MPASLMITGAEKLQVLVTIAIVIASLLPSFTGPRFVRQDARVQPILLQMAAQRPDETVTIIVQKLAGDDSAAQAVTQLGGTVTQDLSIINAFAAEMPAGVVPELARSGGVRWVSLDAEVVNDRDAM